MHNQQVYTPFQKPQPLISFIITYYNLPVQMLCKCINSILAFSLSPSEREIIIIDDGSEVSPMNGLMQYGDEIIYVRQKNSGLSIARNKGISVATGRYLQFVDADDYLVQNAYEHCIDVIKKNQDIEVMMFDFTTSNSNQTVFNDRPVCSGSEYMLKNNIHGTACGYLFQRRTLGELRFTPDIVHEDEEFTPRLLIQTEQVCVTDAKAYYYQKHANSITTSSDEMSKTKRLDDTRDIISRLNYLCDRIPLNDRLALQRRIAQLTMDYLYQTIVQTRSRRELDERIEKLRAEGLFPLPDRNYSQKYKWFRQMSNSRIGRTVLLTTLPLLKKER